MQPSGNFSGRFSSDRVRPENGRRKENGTMKKLLRALLPVLLLALLLPLAAHGASNISDGTAC